MAGVEILETNLFKTVPTIRGVLQNYYANKILIMINGIPTWTPISSNGDIDKISINDVERIEILKGPASVLYGTNAYNGVINIILRNSNKTEVNARLEGGYPGLAASEINVSYKKNDLRIFISGNSRIDNRNPYLTKGMSDSVKIGNAYYYGKDTSYYYIEKTNRYSLNFNAEYKAHSLFFNTYYDAYTYPGLKMSFPSGANTPFVDKGSLVAYTFNKFITEKVNVLFSSQYEYCVRNLIINYDGKMGYNLADQRIGGILKVNYHLSDAVQLELGSDISDGHVFGHETMNRLVDTSVFSNLRGAKDIIEWSVFGQANVNWKQFSLLLGSRYTGNANFGSNISSRASLVYKLNENNSLKLIYGQSFRTPTMLELYVYNTATVVGNPHLNPETSTSYEVAYLTRFDNFLFQVTGFWTQYKDLIQRVVPDVTQPSTYRNVGAFDGLGTEVEVKYENSEFVNLMLNYNYLAGKGSEQYSNFRYVPTHTLTLGLNKSIGNFFVSANSHTYSSTDGRLAKIPAQTFINAHLGYNQNVSDKLKITHILSAKNITDSDMLIPEYMRPKPVINTIATAASGRLFIYTLSLTF